MQKPRPKKLHALLNKKMSLYRRTTVKNSFGEPVETDVKVCDLWVALWPISAKEHIQSDRETMEISHRIRIRYRSGITQGMVFKLGSREFEITQGPINVNEDNRLIDFVVKERV